MAEVRNGDGAGFVVQQMEQGTLFISHCSTLFLFLQAGRAKLLYSAVKGVAHLASCLRLSATTGTE